MAKIVTKLYHLYAVPPRANRARIAASWFLNLFLRPLGAQVGLVRPEAARMAVARHTSRMFDQVDRTPDHRPAPAEVTMSDAPAPT